MSKRKREALIEHGRKKPKHVSDEDSLAQLAGMSVHVKATWIPPRASPNENRQISQDTVCVRFRQDAVVETIGTESIEYVFYPLTTFRTAISREDCNVVRKKFNTRYGDCVHSWLAIEDCNTHWKSSLLPLGETRKLCTGSFCCFPPQVIQLAYGHYDTWEAWIADDNIHLSMTRTKLNEVLKAITQTESAVYAVWPFFPSVLLRVCLEFLVF